MKEEYVSREFETASKALVVSLRKKLYPYLISTGWFQERIRACKKPLCIKIKVK